jgi:hypothetical protein
MGISRIIFSGVLLLIAHTASFAVTDVTDANVCNKYSATRARLSRIYDEYSSLPKKTENAEKLYLLYRQLEQAAKAAQTLYPSDYNSNPAQYVEISECLWDAKFQEMGLFIGHYSDRLEYSEKLMAEAHQLNPYSKYRNYTLYTEIHGKSGTDFFGFPDVDKAQSYLKEFPSGPYATKVTAILAGFYHDLFAALRTIEAEPNVEERNETYSCYDEYIAKHPEVAKQEHARKLGILYFEKVIAATPLKDVKRAMYLDELETLKHGKTDNIVNVCGD